MTGCLQSEIVSLTALMKQVDGLKYSCQASSILDTGDLYDTSARTVNNKQVSYSITNQSLRLRLLLEA